MYKVFSIFGGFNLVLSFLLFMFIQYSKMTLFYMELSSKLIQLMLPFCLDYMSLLFLSVLLMIVGSVYLFASFYLVGDLYFNRFFNILTLFVSSMMVLMIFPHFIFVLVGYDGLGMMSFVLVVYYGSSKSWISGMKTFLINRLGDGFFMCGLMYMLLKGNLYLFKCLEIQSFLFMMFLMGWFTKSAQYPFSSWLPAAMAAPTPVSALVHSSTLVTSGIYLLIRLSSSLYLYMNNICMILGLLTLFMASFSAIIDWDSKKMVAFSTLSQLGLMVFSFGNGLFLLCFFHLMSHAIFKALMFIMVGYYMNMNFHFQDLRFLNNLYKTKSFLFCILLLTILALSGFPFLVGFYSKDLIMEQFLFSNILMKGLFYISLILTSFYSGRLFLNLFSKMKYQNWSKCSNSWVYLSILPLSIFILVFGNSRLLYKLNFNFVNLNLKILMLVFMSLGFLLCTKTMNNLNLYWIFSNICFVNSMNTHFMVHYFSQMGNYFNIYLDQGIIHQFPYFLKIFKNSKFLFLNIENFSKFNMFYWFSLMLVSFIALLIM